MRISSRTNDEFINQKIIKKLNKKTNVLGPSSNDPRQFPWCPQHAAEDVLLALLFFYFVDAHSAVHDLSL